MPSVQDIREKIEKLRGRLSVTVSGIDEAQATLAAAEVEGRPANGKLAALHALIFRRDVLDAEVRKLQAVDLPSAEAAQAAAERAKSLALAHRIHAGRVKSAQALDEAMAAVDSAWANYRAGESYYLEVLRDAGVPRRAPNWRRFLQRAALASMPVVCGALEVPNTMRQHRRPAAELEAGLMRPDGTGGDGEDKEL